MVRMLLVLGALGLAGPPALAETTLPGPNFGLGDLAGTAPRPAPQADAPAGNVTVAGNGRFGLLLEDDETSVSTRLRLNLDANRVTDGGVVIGGRFRMQQETGTTGTGLNAGKLYLHWPAP